jgi:hypothetical protein
MSQLIGIAEKECAFYLIQERETNVASCESGDPERPFPELFIMIFCICDFVAIVYFAAKYAICDSVSLNGQPATLSSKKNRYNDIFTNFDIDDGDTM